MKAVSLKSEAVLLAEMPKRPAEIIPIVPHFPVKDNHIREVCYWHGLPREVLIGKSRVLPHVRARQELCWRLWITETRFSLMAVASIVRQDHTTVIYGVRGHSAREYGTSATASRAEMIAAWQGAKDET